MIGKIFKLLKVKSVDNRIPEDYKYCSSCDGHGYVDLWEKCEECGGEGVVKKSFKEMHGLS